MALTTFGAIMGFAAEMVRQGEEVYRTAVREASDPALRAVFEDLLNDEKKNGSLMEMTRREHVTEMILEPIAGLRQEDYEGTPEVPERQGDVDLLRIAVMLEEKEKRFFDDCSAKISLPEVSRIFRKVARKKESNLEKLENLSRTAVSSQE